MIIVPSMVGATDKREDETVTTMTVGDLIANGGDLRYYGYGPAVVPPFGALANAGDIPGRGVILSFIESYWDGILLSSTRMAMSWSSVYGPIDGSTIQSVTLNGRTSTPTYLGTNTWSFGSGGDSGSRPFRLAEMNTNEQTEFRIVWGDK